MWRQFLLLAAVMASASWSVGVPSRQEKAQSKPNIIFILVDDMGWGDVGAFWQNQRKARNDRSEPWQQTPALDELAAGGVMLTNHYAAAPVCAPSRASLLLGVSQGHANVRDNQFDKELQDTYTLGTVLKRAGYHTAAIGKWGLQGGDPKMPGPDWPAHPAKRGFDYYLGYMRHADGHEHYPKEGIYRGTKEVWDNRTNITDDLDKVYTADLWTAAAKRYVTRQAQAADPSPFFLYLAYDTPHAVLELPTQPYPPGGGLEGGLQWTGRPHQMINTASGTVDSYIYPEYKTATYDHDKDPATPEVNWPETYQRYASAVRRIDDGVGDLIKLLEDLGISDNTLIVFTSDNGPADEDYLPRPRYVQATPNFFNSFGPFDGIKRDTWEGGVREPTIVSWPARIAARRVIDDPSAMYDWMPTLADAAGIAAPARTDGVSLLPLLTGERASAEHPIYVEYFEGRKTPDYPEFLRSHAGRRRNQMQMIRLGDLVGVRYNIQSAGDPFEIYNVVRDPQEAHNLAGDPAYQGMQASMQRYALQNRRPDSDAPRPYDGALIPAVEAQNLKPGLHWSAYGGSFPWVSDVSRLTPSAQGTAALPELSGMTSAGMLVYDGVIRVPEDGEYEFSAQGDAPFIIRLHQALLVDASYAYAPGQRISARIMLKAGFHPVRISLLKRTPSDKGFQIQWHGPGKPMTNMSAADFSRQ